MKRREFLSGSVFAATAGLALDACGPQSNRLIPILVPEEPFVPGEETFVSATCFGCGASCGLLVRKIDGRLVKVEGNPDHPANFGGVCARGQALPQAMYHPDRLTGPKRRRDDGGFDPIEWDEAIAQVSERIAAGARIGFVSGHLTGHRAKMVQRFLGALGAEPGSARHFVHEAFPSAPPAVDLRRAEYIVSLGVELLESSPTSVRFGADLAALRQGRPGRRGKFVMVGPRLSLTAANADEWVPRLPEELPGFAWEVASVLVRDGLHQARDVDGFDDFAARLSSIAPSPDAEHLAREMADHGPAAVVGPGSSFLNALLGTPEIALDPLPFRDWSPLEGPEIEAEPLEGSLGSEPPEILFVADTNPIYSSPRAVEVREWFQSASLRVAFSSFLDETAAVCDLVLAESMSFERYEDAVPPGATIPTASLSAPLLARAVYDTRSMPDALLAIAKSAGQEAAFPWSTYEAALREAWSGLGISWSDAVDNGGFWEESGAGRRELTQTLVEARPATTPAAVASDDPVLYVYASTPFGDGRSAHIPYLQELSDPVNGSRWGSVVEIASERAESLGVISGDTVEVRAGDRTVTAPVFVTPGIHPGVVAIAAGQGHESYGRYATGRGVNALSLLSSPGDLGTRVRLTKVT